LTEHLQGVDVCSSTPPQCHRQLFVPEPRSQLLSNFFDHYLQGHNCIMALIGIAIIGGGIFVKEQHLVSPAPTSQ
jgi:hypothetical protein